MDTEKLLKDMGVGPRPQEKWQIDLIKVLEQIRDELIKQNKISLGGDILYNERKG